MKTIIDFLNRMYGVLNATLSFVIKGKDVKLEIGPGGSYTDGKYMHIGVSEAFEGLSLKIIYMLTVALIGHEGQHILSSNFPEFQRYNEEEVAKLRAKGVSRRFASHYVHSIGNIIEDGRIENILVNRLPGFIPKIQYLNMFFWNKGAITEETDELSAFMNTILSLSVLGIYPKNYQILKGSRVDKEIDKIKHLIPKGVKAMTCRDGLDICREILAIAEPFVLELYEDIRLNEEMMEEIMKLLEQFMEEHKNSLEEDYNDSHGQTSHIQQDDEDEKQNGKGNPQAGDGESQEGEEGDEESSSKSGSSKSEENEDGEDSKAGSDEDDEGAKSKDEDGKEDSKSKDCEDSKNDEESKEAKDKSESDSDTKEQSNEDNSSDSLSEGLDRSGEDIKRDTDDDIDKKMKELAEELEAEAEKDIQKNERDEKIREKNKPKDIRLSQQEANRITKEIFPDLTFNEIKEKFPLDADLPTETMVAGKKFKRQVRDIFNSKSQGSIGSQEKGVLDVENIFRVGMGNYNVFKTEVVQNGREHVLYFVRDGSGSMAGQKDMASMLALAVMEEGLKGVVPFKAVTFKTGRGGVEHIVIKDWNDNSNKNYAYNYIQRYRAGGGNIDSVTIQIAAEELLRRPEKDKTLIVLSDGLPYSIEATKASIKDVKSKGINVIGIMFGDESFRNRNLETYKDMYQTNIIATSVNRIPNKLIDVLKQTLRD